MLFFFPSSVACVFIPFHTFFIMCFKLARFLFHFIQRKNAAYEWKRHANAFGEKSMCEVFNSLSLSLDCSLLKCSNSMLTHISLAFCLVRKGARAHTLTHSCTKMTLSMQRTPSRREKPNYKEAQFSSCSSKEKNEHTGKECGIELRHTRDERASLMK